VIQTKGNDLLILSPQAIAYADIIHASGFLDLNISQCKTVDDALARAGEANIILGDPDLLRKILPAMDRLEWAQSTWAGVNLLTGKDCRKDYLLTGVKDVFGSVMAEYVICYILMHERNVFQCFASQQKKQWKMPRPGLLRGKRVGIMGVGAIGTAIAEAAKFFKVHTSGYSRTPSPRAFIDQVFEPGQLLEFVEDLDYLISVLPDTPNTTHLINGPVFSAMKPEAVLINVGRGNAVEENGLVEALNSKEIAGAVLDVFQEEPLPKAHPFWETEGMIVTSHKAALSYPEDIAPLFIDNYRRFAAGRPLKYQVDFAKGY
jgi:phosphoglycerate dehydrogenase-like enzyme